MAVDQRIKAGKIWPILVEAASAKTKIPYRELGPRVGMLHRNLNLPLDVIAKYCKRIGWPPLTVVIVTADDPGPAGLLDGEDPEEAFRRVCDYDWSRVKNPFELFRLDCLNHQGAVEQSMKSIVALPAKRVGKVSDHS